MPFILIIINSKILSFKKVDNMHQNEWLQSALGEAFPERI